MPKDLTHLSDEALVALVARGDEVALGELYDRYGRVSFGLALRILRDEALAEDAVQEAFLTVWRTAGRFMPGAGEGKYVDPHARPPARRRSRATRAATPGGRSRRRPTRRPVNRPRRRPGSGCSASASRRRSEAGCRIPSARRSSSPTTAASRSPSSQRGSVNRSVRSSRGCSQVWAGSGNCWPSPAESTNGTRRNSRADGRVRPRRARRRRRARVRGSPSTLRALQRGAHLPPGDSDRPGLRGRRARAAQASPRADPRPRRSSERSNVVPIRRRWVAPRARGSRGGRGSRGDRARIWGAGLSDSLDEERGRRSAQEAVLGTDR